MNWLDIVILIIIGIGTVVGLWKGLIKMALALAGLAAGVFLAGRYYVPLSEHLTFVSSSVAARILAFIIILAGTALVAAIIAALLTRLTSLLLLGWLNHLGGAIFGLLLGALLIGTALALWVRYFGMADLITESRIAPLLLHYLPFVPSLLPDLKGNI